MITIHLKSIENKYKLYSNLGKFINRKLIFPDEFEFQEHNKRKHYLLENINDLDPLTPAVSISIVKTIKNEWLIFIQDPTLELHKLLEPFKVFPNSSLLNDNEVNGFKSNLLNSLKRLEKLTVFK